MRNNREISFSVPSILRAKSITLIAFFLSWSPVFAQFADNFSDGDFTTNPAWTGSANVFTINTSQQLQLNNVVAASSYLSAPVALANLNELNWEFYVKQTFASSSSNFGRVYLVSDQANLSGSLNGYFVQFGEAGTSDAVELFKQTGTTLTSVCRAVNGKIANSFGVRVKVSRDNVGLWKLLIDYNGGTDFVQEGCGTDVTHTSSSFIGVLCVYTATNANKYFYDDFSINPFVVPDTSPPTIQSITVNSSNELTLNFSEVVEKNSSELLTNYSISEESINPITAILLPGNKSVNLSFDQHFPNGVDRKIDVSGVKDLADNQITPTQKTFMYFNPVPALENDILINEIFADPSPSVGLPEVEFLEIYNRSANPFNLNGWKITDGTTTGILTNLILRPNEFLILTPSSTASQFNSFGKVMGLSIFPSLNNSGDAMVLMDANGKTINSVKYSSTWYKDEDKQNGGFTLERIDPEDFCGDAQNWTASNDAVGGTPGKQNSVYELTPDVSGPKLIAYSVLDAKTIALEFNEKLSSTPPTSSDFAISPALTITSISFTDALLNKVKLVFAEQIESTKIYTLKASTVFDCPRNLIQNKFNEVKIKLDNVPPTVLDLTFKSDTELNITFSETMDESMALASSSYDMDGVQPKTVTPVEGNKYALMFEERFVNGVERTLHVSSLSDLSENILAGGSYSILYFVPKPLKRGDIIISEIFADPSPTVGLPESEFVELYNRSANPIQLAGWQITDGISKGLLPSTILLPQSYLVVSPSWSASQFSAFGKTVGLSIFPSLNNSSDSVLLKDAHGWVIDSLRYSSAWYHSDEKKDGGWTLEKMDLENFCLEGENWTASINDKGGTPGRANSVMKVVTDLLGPKLTTCSVIGESVIQLDFDERLARTVPSASNVQISPPLPIDRISFLNEQLKSLHVKVVGAVLPTTKYTISISNVFDCPGNIIQPEYSTGELKGDQTKPSILEVKVVSKNELQIKFSEAMSQSSVLEATNYSTLNSSPVEVLDYQNNIFLLRFNNDFENGLINKLETKGLTDLIGNPLENPALEFIYFQDYPSQFKDVIISEIFADQSPSIGLPESEFIELYNRSDHPFDLKGWTISDDGAPIPLQSKIILPKERLILCTSAQVQKFLPYGKTLGVANFPSLNNSADAVVLRNANGSIIDSVHYELSWYQDSEKQDGGWSLELIYSENICAEKGNWRASEDTSGGTPGKSNSVEEEKVDLTGPRLMSCVATGQNQLTLTFDEKLAHELPGIESFRFTPSLSPQSVTFSDKTLTSLVIDLSTTIESGVRYELVVDKIFDCPGNRILETSNSAFFAVPEIAEIVDLVINEILFNPTNTGVDFIEVYNKSHKYINLKGWKFATIEEGEVTNQKIISRDNLLIEPKSYLVFTESVEILKNEYSHGVENNFLQIDIPSLPDSEGSVVMLSDDDRIIDILNYKDDYHSVFIQDNEGISLERLIFDGLSDDDENWKSANSIVRATPGYLNSNAITADQSSDETLLITPEVFLPMDGQPNFATINYQFDKAGYIGSVRIFDANGNVIKQIANNELLSATGFFRWDGDRDDGTRARVGSYMVFVELFDERGVIKAFRKRVVVAGRF